MGYMGMTTVQNMKKAKLSALLLAAGLATVGVDAARAAATLTFNDGAPVVSAGTYTLTSGVYVGGSYIPTGAPLNAQFGPNAVGEASEFRMVGADGAVGGGGEKSIVGIRDDGTTGDNGTTTIIWNIDDAGTLTGTDGDTTPGAPRDPDAPGGTTGLWTNAVFFSQFFGFHDLAAPPVSVTFNGSAVGPIADGDPIDVSFNIITAQWGGSYFPMGDADALNECNNDGQGCTFTLSGTVSNVVTDGSGNSTFDFELFGEHRITSYEDTEGGTAAAGNGFAGWVAQWALQGSGSLVPPVGNVPPTADAGADQTAIEGAAVTLDGSGSTDSDGSVVSYSWVQTGGTAVTLSDATAVQPTFTAPAAPDTLTFDLTVTDDGGDTDTASTTVTVVAQQPPVADAGPDQTVNEGSLESLDGTGSTDPDGSIVGYNWTQTGGTSVTLSDPTIASPTFTAPAAPDTLNFSLTVTDDQGLQDTATTSVTVQAAAGADDLNSRNDALITDVGTAGMVNVLLNDGGDGTLNVSASDTTSTRGGTVNCTANGECTYSAPSAGFSGTDTFGYTASDSTGSDAATVFITVGSVPADGIVLSLHNRGAADQQQRYSLQGGVYTGGTFIPTGPAFDDAFDVSGIDANANAEFRMIDPGSTIGGGGEKSAAGLRDDSTGSDTDIFQWIFDANGVMSDSTGLIDTDSTPVVTQDSPTTARATSTNAIFFGDNFSFQLLGPVNVALDFANNVITVAWPDGLNAHWAGRFFPLGEPDPDNECNTDGQGCGITFSGPMTDVVTAGGDTTFDYKLFGETRITPYEDTERNTRTGAGFKGWRPQWELHGSGVFTGAVSALESPSGDNGTIGPTPGGPADGNSFDDGRTSLDELAAAGVPADDGVDPACIGSCFDFTVTGMTNPDVKVVLPLSSPISGDNAVYRKFISGQWRDFDTSTGDTAESALLASGGTCAALTDADWQADLVAGANCVRLTIADGGPNDADGSVNSQVQDPGGVGIPVAGGNIVQAPSDTVGSGCSIGPVDIASAERADWWILAAFLAWLGVLAGRRERSSR